VNIQNLKVAVIGCSIGGLSAANVLNRLGFEVTVFEGFSEGFHNRGGALGSVDIQLLQTILPTGTIQKLIRNHGHFYGDLWKYLYEGLPKYSVKFGVEIQEIHNPESLKPTLKIQGKLQEFDLIIGADGGKSTIRKYVTDAVPQYAGYTLWRTLLSTDKIGFHQMEVKPSMEYATKLLDFLLSGQTKNPYGIVACIWQYQNRRLKNQQETDK
jgi:2-polyprenyl-6-methoxyphenol hydroxylase-like FAD-dependent oxidoreductase